MSRHSPTSAQDLADLCQWYLECSQLQRRRLMQEARLIARGCAPTESDDPLENGTDHVLLLGGRDQSEVTDLSDERRKRRRLLK